MPVREILVVLFSPPMPEVSLNTASFHGDVAVLLPIIQVNTHPALVARTDLRHP